MLRDLLAYKHLGPLIVLDAIFSVAFLMTVLVSNINCFSCSFCFLGVCWCISRCLLVRHSRLCLEFFHLSFWNRRTWLAFLVQLSLRVAFWNIHHIFDGLYSYLNYWQCYSPLSYSQYFEDLLRGLYSHVYPRAGYAQLVWYACFCNWSMIPILHIVWCFLFH